MRPGMRMVGLAMGGALMALGQEAKPEADEGVAYLRLLLASGRLQEAPGCPARGFFLELENKTASDLQVALAIPSQGDPDSRLFASLHVEGLVHGWWKVPPGAKRRIFIERGLPQAYFLHARNAKHFWGKDQVFQVPCGDSEKPFPFNRYLAAAKGSIDAEGRVVLTHAFSE